MQNLYWSYLANQSSQFTQLLIILELTYINLQGCDVEKAHSDVSTISFDRHHIFRLVSQISVLLEGTLCDYITN